MKKKKFHCLPMRAAVPAGSVGHGETQVHDFTRQSDGAKQKVKHTHSQDVGPCGAWVESRRKNSCSRFVTRLFTVALPPTPAPLSLSLSFLPSQPSERENISSTHPFPTPGEPVLQNLKKKQTKKKKRQNVLPGGKPAV
jgi:hypothetical protein